MSERMNFGRDVFDEFMGTGLEGLLLQLDGGEVLHRPGRTGRRQDGHEAAMFAVLLKKLFLKEAQRRFGVGLSLGVRK